MAREYRVIWKREGLSRKERIYARRPSALNLARRLLATSALENLTLRGVDPDDLSCCNGYQCGCDGKTNLEAEEAYRKDLPALEFAGIESREVGEWTAEAEDLGAK